MTRSHASLATVGVIGLALAVTTPALAQEATATATAAAPKPATSTHTTPAPAPAPAPKPTIDAVVAPAPPPAPPTATATPLATLPVHEPTKLQLAPEPASSSWGYKIAFGLVVVAGGVIAWKKKKGGGLGFTPKADGELRITARANVGMRAEIAVVEVSGMRILVGITAQSIQNLAVLDDDAAANEDLAAPESTPEPIQTRARLLFGDVTPAQPVREPIRQVAARYADVEATPTVAPPKRAAARRARLAPAPPPVDDDDRPIEGQARGITLSLKK